MAEHEILKDLFFIERGYLNGNHFVYRSRSPILIDTAYITGFNETESIITGLGVNLSDVSLIINTHTHCDHIGGNRPIQQKSGCDIALHKVGRHYIDTRDDWSMWWKYYDQEADFFKCTSTLEDGEIIAIGPYEFQVIYTPGHSSDGIVLYNRREKVLISADTLWESDIPAITLRIEGSLALFNAQESLQKLESLDVKRVYPGHGKPFNDIKSAILLSQEKISRYLLEPEVLGNDQIKRIMIYTLLNKKTFNENDFFPYLMNTYWYKETVDLFFNSEYELIYHKIMDAFFARGIVKLTSGNFVTTVKP